MVIDYALFYRRFGIRLTSQLINPPMTGVELLNLPKNSIYHYLGTGPLDEGPTETEACLRNNKKPFSLMNVTALSLTKGNPRRLPIDVERMARNFRIRHPRFRVMKSLLAATRDPQAIGVFNYAYINRLYRYPRHYLNTYYSGLNILSTVFSQMKDILQTVTHHQFLEFDCPTIIPSLSQLRMGSRLIDQRSARVFQQLPNLIILEVFNWLGENREQSFLSNLSDTDIQKVNLIFKETGRWTVVNLGQLDKWRKPTKKELEANPDIKDTGLPADQMQKMFLRLMIGMVAVRTETSEEINQQIPEDLKDVEIDPETQTDIEIEDAEQVPDPNLHDEQNLNDSEELDWVELPEDLEVSIDQTLSQLEIATAPPKEDEVSESFSLMTEVPSNLEGAIVEYSNQLAENGNISALEYQRAIENAGTYQHIIAPNGQTLDKFIQISPEHLSVPETQISQARDTIPDSSMLHSSLMNMDKKYVTEVMQRDIAAMTIHLQQAGVIVQDYQVEEYKDAVSHYHMYSVQVKPVQGSQSTLRFQIPKVQEDGTYRINGVKYRTRRQRGSVPIQKISPDVVSLTSYYGKIFTHRSQLRVNNYDKWLNRKILSIGLTEGQTVLSEMIPGNAFKNINKVPRLYSLLAQQFRQFHLNDGTHTYQLNFDYAKRQSLLPDPAIKLSQYEKNGVVMGRTSSGDVLIAGNDDQWYRLVLNPDHSVKEKIQCPSIESILGIAQIKAPLEMVELKVFGKLIPMGIILGYYLGLSQLTEQLGVKPRIVPTGQRLQLQDHEWPIVFQDEVWIFSRRDRLATMILSGWRNFETTTSSFPVNQFDESEVYFNLLEDQGLGVRYLREFDLMKQMFIDPITKSLLEEMKEPVIFPALIIRSAQLLLVDYHPDEMDARYLRDKGYERFSGFVYESLVKTLRVHNARASKQNYPLELNPYDVWINITEDPAKVQCVELNPIQELKEIEAITFSGKGGRSGRSMVKRQRVYHPSMMGTTSEATTDDENVGVNFYLSANPQYTSLRGTARQLEPTESNPTALLSTSALLAPGSTNDDMKRLNFIQIQNGHLMACKGYTQPMLRTGYEQVIANRNHDLFAVIAKQKGIVKSLTPEGMIVQYADDSLQGIQLGRRFGKAAGLNIPHEIASPLKKGQSFEVGDVLAFNTGFYEQDIFNPKQIVFKSSKTVRVALLESAFTLEDSSSISKAISMDLTTKITKLRTIVVNFNQEIHELLTPGTLVDYESILCVIDDTLSGDSKALDKETIESLKVLSAQTPLAKFKGRIEAVEIYYHGEKEDMSRSLLKLTEQSDVQLIKRYKSIGESFDGGSVNENFRIENEPLLLDTAAIQIYISADVPASVGDKGVFGNQMKSIFGDIFDDVKTESGQTIDAIFSAASIDNRIVLSPYSMGTTNSLLDVIGQKMVQAYRS